MRRRNRYRIRHNHLVLGVGRFMNRRMCLSVLIVVVAAPGLTQSALPSPRTRSVVKWSQEHFDAAHTGLNPFETVLGPTNVPELRLALALSMPLTILKNVVVGNDLVYAVGS